MRSRACFPFSRSMRSRSCRISGVRGIGSLPLLPLELEADEDPPLRIIPELMFRLPYSPEFAPYCRRVANLFVCFTMLGLSCVVPAPLLMGIVGGPGLPKLRRVGVVCSAHVVAVPSASVTIAVPRVGACTPLPLGGSSDLACCHVSMSASSIVSSS